jgi:hypothetical protein
MLRLLAVVPLLCAVGCFNPPDPRPVTVAPADALPTDTPLDIETVCASNLDCVSLVNFPVCDVAATPHKCVECTADSRDRCTADKPVCGGADACIACATDDQCGTGGLCLATGACIAPTSILHAVSTQGSLDGATCGGIDKPCTLSTALAAVTATRNVIKLDDAGTYTPDATVLSGNFAITTTVTIYATGATLHRKNMGAILSIADTGSLTLHDGTLEQAAGDGISCSAAGSLTVDGATIKNCDNSAINATNCSVTVTHAMLTNNSQVGVNTGRFPGINISGGSITLSQSEITGTRGGGLVVASGQFVIVGNAILANGDNSGATGGVTVAVAADVTDRFEFNTVAANMGPNGAVAGVQCTGGPLAVKNNIIWDNNGASAKQVSGSCVYSYSDIGPTAVSSDNDSGVGNFNLNPNLANEMNDPHLQSGSMAIGKADQASDLSGLATLDIDSEPRKVPIDPGADQTQP